MPTNSVKKTKTSQKPEQKEKAKITIPVILTALILGLITFSFLFTSNGNNSVATDIPTIAKFNGKDILVTDKLYTKTYGNYEYLYQLYGMSPSESEISSMAVKEVIHTYSLAEEARIAGIPVNKQEVSIQESKYGLYLDDTGKFSALKYEKVSGAERKGITDMFSRMNLASYVENDFNYTNSVSDSEKKALSNMGVEQRKISYVSISSEAYPEAKLAEYGKSQPDLFIQLTLSRITTQKSKSSLEKIRKAIVADAARWDELVSSSDDPYSQDGGKMGQVFAYQIKSELSTEEDFKKVLSLKKGEISEVFETEDAYVIFRADEEPKAPDFASSNLLKTVYSYILSNDDTIVLDYLREEAEKLIAKMKIDGFSEAAAAEGFTVHGTNFFGLNYGSLGFMPALTVEDGDTTLSAISKNKEFYKSVFSLKPDDIAPALPLLNKIIVYRLDDTKALTAEEIAAQEATVASTITSQSSLDLTDYLKTKYKTTY